MVEISKENLLNRTRLISGMACQQADIRCNGAVGWLYYEGGEVVV
jgi:hypothetical protein